MKSFFYGQFLCTILSEQKMFGKVICTIYIPELDKVERVPKSELVSCDEIETGLSPEEIVSIAAAGKIFDALNNYTRTIGEDVLLAPLDSAVTPLPHQLDTLKRAIGGSTVRMLLADEVGLGKTIEAGLIIRELKLRGLIQRVLIVAPAGLTKQWISEMKVHFGEEFHLFIPSQVEAADELLKAARSSINLENDDENNPYLLSDSVVCPLDAIKPIRRRKGWTKEQVDEYNMKRFLNVVHADWDLVVIDESHRVAGADETVARFRLGMGLGEAAPNILLLSATPHQGKSDAFHRLLSILDPEEFEGQRLLTKASIQPYMIRHEKRKTVDGSGKSLFLPRHTHTLNICWESRHQPQRELYDAVTEYIRHGYNALARMTKKKRVVVGFLLILIQRLMASSTPAIGRMLEKRLNILKNPPSEPDADTEIDSLFDDYDAMTGEEMESQQLSIPEISEGEIAQVENLLDLVRIAQNAGPDAKAEKLLSLLYELQAEDGPEVKMLIFTEFTATQEMLRKFLTERGIRCCVINGSLDINERLSNQSQFADDTQVLISTEAGGEGLNLQFCHIVVNYDMPWNPMRIEQRIGRVDRIGQKHDVQAFNLMIAETVEAHVREVIEQKLATILKDIGVDKLSDILDSGEASANFDAVYKAAMQTETNIEEPLHKIEQVLRDAAKSARQFAYLYESPGVTADVAQDYLQHPFPYWVESMVTSFCRTHGGTATKQKQDWSLRLPDGSAIPHAVFNLKELEKNPLASFLAVNNKAVSDMLAELVRHRESGSKIPCIASKDLPSAVHGTFALYKLDVKSGDWSRSRVLPVFLADDGRTFNNTAKTIHDLLLGGSFSTSGMADFEIDRLWDSAESILEPYFEELQRIYAEEQERDLKKKTQLFESRKRSLGRVGIDNIRLSRLSKLEKERQSYVEYHERQRTLLPEVQLLLALKVNGGQ